MTTFETLDKYLKNKTKNFDDYPDIVTKGINTIAGEIPFKLKLAITLSELITFSSHLRKPIKLYDGTLVPTNAFVFALSPSGSSKDRALSIIRKSMANAYDDIEQQREKYAKERAENIARIEGEGVHEWQKYYNPPKPLKAGLGTVEGLLHHFADIAENPIGAGSITSSEIGSELQSNGSMVDIIKTISVAYDLGDVPAKIVKSQENQTKALKTFPVNALFFGSHEALLFNNDIKSKFKLVFNTQLARRSIFTFTPDAPPRIQIKSVDDLYKIREKERAEALKAQSILESYTTDLVSATTNDPLVLSPEANKLFDVYMEYNSILSDELTNKFPISKLSRKHKQWLALKLSGSYAILHRHSVITEEDYLYAINTVEFLSEDLINFEKELVKEPYEQLVDYCKYKADKNEFFISLHELRKLSYISGAGSSKNKVEELVTLANSCDIDGSYIIKDEGIQYKEIIKTDIVGVSYIIFNTTLKNKKLKEYMATRCHNGFEFYETDFAEIELLLQENAVYGSFRFDEGKRSKDNVTGGTKFVILDIDKSRLTDKEAHVLLDEYNHYIIRTSDPDNEYKFRVLMELDSVVDIDDMLWKAFITEIGENLGLIVDILPKSQIYFSFADRAILKQLNGKTLNTKNLLEKASTRLKDRPSPPSALPVKEKTLKLNDPRETFSFAFNAEQGERSIRMYRALAYAIDLGANEEYLTSLAYEINDYWAVPMDKDRLERTLLKPALRRL